MDIISEILETDKLADEKIIKAHERQAELEKKTDEEIAAMKQEADEKVSAYRAKLETRTRTETDTQLSKSAEEEQEKINKLDELYAAKHNEWEKAIIERILTSSRA